MKVFFQMLLTLLLLLLLAQLAFSTLTVRETDIIREDVNHTFSLARDQHKAGKTVNLAEQQQQPANLNIPVSIVRTPWSLGMAPTVLNRVEAMESLIVRVQQEVSNKYSEVTQCYLRTAANYLTSRNPAERAVACEFFAHFPVQTVEQGYLPRLGVLLDDKNVAFSGEQIVYPQQGSARKTPTMMTVGEVADIALINDTGIHFPSSDVFTVWWRANKDTYANCLWYWRIRYHGKEDNAALFTVRPPARALKIALLLSNRGARQNEMQMHWTNPAPIGLEMMEEVYNSPDPAVIIQFVKAQQLQRILFDALGEQSWPELRGNESAFNSFLYRVQPVILAVGTKADARTLESLAADPRSLVAPWPTYQAQLILLATQLDKEQAEAILLRQLDRLPTVASLYSALIAQTGLRHRERVTAAYRDTPTMRDDLVTAVGQSQDPGARDLLGEWFAGETFELQLNEHGYPTEDDYIRYDLLRAYAGAAKVMNHEQPIIADKLLSQCSSQLTKADAETIKARLDAVPAARAQAVTLLSAFFQAVQ